MDWEDWGGLLLAFLRAFAVVMFFVDWIAIAYS